MNAGNKLTGKSDGCTSEYKITFVGGSIIEARTFDRRIQETPSELSLSSHFTDFLFKCHMPRIFFTN